jgi:hypothetical protein
MLRTGVHTTTVNWSLRYLMMIFQLRILYEKVGPVYSREMFAYASGTDDNYETFKSEYPVFRLRFEPNTSPMCSRLVAVVGFLRVRWMHHRRTYDMDRASISGVAYCALVVSYSAILLNCISCWGSASSSKMTRLGRKWSMPIDDFTFNYAARVLKF